MTDKQDVRRGAVYGESCLRFERLLAERRPGDIALKADNVGQTADAAMLAAIVALKRFGQAMAARPRNRRGLVGGRRK